MNYKENDFEPPKAKLIPIKRESTLFSKILYYMCYIVTLLSIGLTLTAFFMAFEFLPMLKYINIMTILSWILVFVLTSIYQYK